MAALSLHHEIIKLEAGEVKQAALRLSENRALIFDSTWREDFAVKLGRMAAEADAMAYLDAPSSLSDLSKAARRVALEMRLATFLLVSSTEDFDEDKANEGVELWLKVSDLLQEMLDTRVRLCWG